MRIAFTALPGSGHLNPMTALARRFESRGHDVVFLGLIDAEGPIRAAGLKFVPFAEADAPAGTIRKLTSRLSQLRGVRQFATASK
jgi:zeaxanthin glucosyltransferase